MPSKPGSLLVVRKDAGNGWVLATGGNVKSIEDTEVCCVCSMHQGGVAVGAWVGKVVVCVGLEAGQPAGWERSG